MLKTITLEISNANQKKTSIQPCQAPPSLAPCIKGTIIAHVRLPEAVLGLHEDVSETMFSPHLGETAAF